METQKPKIISFEAQAVKKIKAVSLQFTKSGLSIIGGKNKKGKTSIIDGLAYLFGGEKKRPSQLKNNEVDGEPYLRAELSNGLVVERKGKNSSLKVTDPKGEKSGQTLLNSFVSEFSLNIEKFIHADGPKKRELLLKSLGDSEKLAALEAKEKELVKEREFANREVKNASGAFESAPIFADAPKEEVSLDSIQKELEEANKVNRENQEKRDELLNLEESVSTIEADLEAKDEEIERLKLSLEKAKKEKNALSVELQNEKDEVEELSFDVDCLTDLDLEPIQAKFSNFTAINQKIEANKKKEELRQDLRVKEKKAEELDEKVKAIREEKKKIVDVSKTKLDGLEWDGDELVYKGQRWDNMSGAEEMIVATSIARVLTPNAGFVFIDKLEQMDLDTLSEFGEWLEGEDLQAIGTRVSTGDECSFILEDGEVKE